MDLLYGENPKGEYPASYYVASANQQLSYPPLDGDRAFDVAIIGAGYAGLSAAIVLAEKGFSVAVLEAQRVGWGASGRNGGQMGSGQRLDQETLERMTDDRHARQLWDLAEEAKATVKGYVARYAIECDLKPGIIYADHKQRFVKGTKEYVRLLYDKYGYDQISFLDRKALREQIGTDAYYAGTLDWGAGHLHPLNFALGLAEAAEHEGATIFEQTRVIGVEQGKKPKVKTETGTITAEHVIYACNGYLGDLQPRIGERVMPINSYIVATEPLSDELAKDVIRNDVAVADSRFVVNYYRLSADKRMIFGGRESYGYRYPDDISESVRKRMVGIYPQLNDAKIDYYWGGTLGITMNRMPHLARLSDNILTTSGFSGHGVAMATLCGKLAAEAVAGQAERFDIMGKLPIPRFPGGMHFRRPLLVMAMLYFAMRDRI